MAEPTHGIDAGFAVDEGVASAVEALIAAHEVPTVVVEALRRAEHQAAQAQESQLRALADVDNQRKRMARAQQVERRAGEDGCDQSHDESTSGG